MDTEHRDRNIQVGVIEVGVREPCVPEVARLVTQNLELDGLRAKAVFAQHLLASGQAVPGGLVLVEQVTAQQNKVDLLLLGDLERLLKGHVRVHAPLRVLFHEAQVVVRGHQDFQDVGGVARVDLVQVPSDGAVAVVRLGR